MLGDLDDLGVADRDPRDVIGGDGALVVGHRQQIFPGEPASDRGRPQRLVDGGR